MSHPRVLASLVLLLTVSIHADPPAAPPVIVPDAPVMKLDELGIYTFGYAQFKKPEVRFPVGWHARVDEATGSTLDPIGPYQGRDAVLMHCPWRGSTGVSFQEFNFALPRAKRILLRGATAMHGERSAGSDGVTFRVFAAGKTLMDQHQTQTTWQPFEFDLTALGGTTAVVRFEVHPGPKNNASFDFSLWGGREVVIEGATDKWPSHPDPLPLDLAKMGPSRSEGIVPPSGFDGKSTFRRDQQAAVLRYGGPDGLLEYRWELPREEQDSFLGNISLAAQMTGDAAVTLPLAGDAKITWAKPAKFEGAAWEAGANDSATCVSRWRVGEQTATLRITGRMIHKSLVFDVSCDAPLISALACGDFGPVMRQRTVPVPYCMMDVRYLARENLFATSMCDWTISNASSNARQRATYDDLTDGSRNKLSERIIYTAAWHLAEVLPNVPNPPSPFLKELAGRVVSDVWGPKFEQIARQFEALADYGIRDQVVLVHVWQNLGYDNGYPKFVPAYEKLGGDAAMKDLVKTGTKLGWRVALHENYVDYYPNYDKFDENHIALKPDGHRMNAWFNKGTKIQSFAIKAPAILPLAATQAPDIHQRYGTNGCFLDVHSSVPPWFHVDHRAGEPGAGTYRIVFDTHAKLWQYERDVHGGPVFGEGNNHAFWAGLLDGAEAQFGIGWTSTLGTGRTAPLLVDFDLLKVHPLVVNHGMGYYERWSADMGRGRLPLMAMFDQYRMQEAIYGHAGFLGTHTFMSIPHAWLEHHLLTPVTARANVARPAQIRYEVDGKWVDATAAAKANEFRRAQVVYDNGLTVTANDRDETLKLAAHELPRFGWLAEGAGVTAYTALRGGVVCDYAETADTVFANARAATDWNFGQTESLPKAAPRVGKFTQTGDRQFQVQYAWRVLQNITAEARCFVHFGKPGAKEDILFQQDHSPKLAFAQWKPGGVVDDGPWTVKVPDNVADGTYDWVIGLYRPGQHDRISLLGPRDAGGRTRLGLLRVAKGGKVITFEPVPEVQDGTEAEYEKLVRMNLNQNDAVVDFGTLRTNGSVRVRREGGEWVLQTCPRDRAFTLELSAARFGKPATVKCVGSASEHAAVRAGEFWRLPLNGAKEYRWPAAGR